MKIAWTNQYRRQSKNLEIPRFTQPDVLRTLSLEL